MDYPIGINEFEIEIRSSEGGILVRQYHWVAVNSEGARVCNYFDDGGFGEFVLPMDERLRNMLEYPAI